MIFDGWKSCDCTNLFSIIDSVNFFFRNSLFNLKVGGLSPVCLWSYYGFVMLTLVKTLPLMVAPHYQVSWGQFLLMAAIFCKASLMIKYSTIAHRGNSIQFLCIPTHYNFINWSLHNLVLSVLLFEGILLNICWFINIALMAKGIIIHAWMELMYTYIFSMNHGFLVLMNTS